ncbi:MAG TPA: magnesium transporter CorA family protein [Ideonella sp.]|uniref:magnesium transporter CorA family protein n=1 Tax=Ideonella sp. TaxID=1929293 RepID=UPI002BCF9CFD|nr:magnesium transporter CorA family protein [Ideonella sp.]HSI46800.1 magnesium transporter CorA family protein [Ideonella sp.]
MRIFHIDNEHFTELEQLPATLPAQGYLWIGNARREFEARVGELQRHLQHWTGAGLVDLHVSDLLNNQLPSHYDDTSWYDMLVFRRLSAGAGGAVLPPNTPVPAMGRPPAPPHEAGTLAAAHQALAAIDTSPVGFAVFDRVLITVHPADCMVREYFAQRLQQHSRESDLRGSARLPTSPADLMLRMVNYMVDSYLELRRLLTRHLGTLQAELLKANSRFADWQLILSSREALHLLEDTCEDQRSAIQEWIDALDEWPEEASVAERRERELLRVRSRDVLEHIERVLSHVRRLEQSAEAAVQMHFSALGQRTNDIMRTLTVLTAIFLPLNLITGIFGMNFEWLPLIHKQDGFWIAVAVMFGIGIGLGLFFWRKRYLGTRSRQ